MDTAFKLLSSTDNFSSAYYIDDIVVSDTTSVSDAAPPVAPTGLVVQ